MFHNYIFKYNAKLQLIQSPGNVKIRCDDVQIRISVSKKTPITALRMPQKWSFTKSELPFLGFFAVAQE